MGLFGNFSGLKKENKEPHLEEKVAPSVPANQTDSHDKTVDLATAIETPKAEIATMSPQVASLKENPQPSSAEPVQSSSVTEQQTPPEQKDEVSITTSETQPHPTVPNPQPSMTPQPALNTQTSAAPQTSPSPQSSVNILKQASAPQVQPTPAPAAKPSVEKVETKQPDANDVKIECLTLGKINSVTFSDVYITPEKKTYIWGGKTNAGLVEVAFEDFDEFLKEIENAYEGTRSYLLQYQGRNYRVERTIATGGPQFCARKMPTHVPNLKDLGLPQGVYNHLLSLAGASGLILLAGATGSGKSTTIAALLKEYLSQKGGYAFTIEDPVELPLDGVYVTPNKELGLCKQTVPPEGKWEEGIKSALRSKPRYIYLGEIRSPDIASEALRAATSGHLVLSSIHANNVNEAVNSLVKYAASSGISESMAYELVAGGLLGIVHQILTGAPKRAQVTTIFANPDVNSACQVRGMIRSGKLNMATLMEQQRILLQNNKPLFSQIL